MNRSKQFLLKLLVVVGTLFVLVACARGPSAGAFLTVNDRQCTACGQCVSVCSVDAIRIINQKAVIDPSECIECGKCVEKCPEEAIQ